MCSPPRRSRRACCWRTSRVHVHPTSGSLRSTASTKMAPMKIRHAIFPVLLSLAVTALCAEVVIAQARGARAGGAAAAPRAQQVHGTLLQVMRGILFPNSNVLFASQSVDPASVKKEADPSSSVNPLSGQYGGWEAIE